MSTRVKDVLIVLVVGVVAFFAYKMYKRRAVAIGSPGLPAGQTPVFPTQPYYPPATTVNQLPATGGGYGRATGGAPPGGGGTSGAQDFASIASGIGSLASSAIGLAGAFGGLGGGGSWDTSTGSDTYFGGGPGDDSSDQSYYMY
jgi:hypothetical protein